MTTNQQWPLRVFREDLPRPLTLEAVAALVRSQFGLKCTPSHIANGERGVGRLSVRVLAALATIYGRPRAQVHRAYQSGLMLAAARRRRRGGKSRVA